MNIQNWTFLFLLISVDFFLMIKYNKYYLFEIKSNIVFFNYERCFYSILNQKLFEGKDMLSIFSLFLSLFRINNQMFLAGKYIISK